jgi:hypothetical protein
VGGEGGGGSVYGLRPDRIPHWTGLAWVTRGANDCRCYLVIIVIVIIIIIINWSKMDLAIVEDAD